MNKILEFISNVCPITGNDFADTFLFVLIGFAAFRIAWIFTGAASDMTGLHNSKAMSGFHWLIRTAIFLAILVTVIGLVHLFRWMNTWKWWGFVILAVVVAHVVAGTILLVIFHKKKRKISKEDE